MQTKNLISKYPKSVYTYGAYKNLLEAYYQNENYSDALSAAKYLIQNYNEQAVSDGITARASEIEKILNGTDRRIVEKETEYKKNGGVSARAGRKSGSELVKLYSAYGSSDDAYALAVSLIERQVSAEEFAEAAENSEFAADYKAGKGESEKAAGYYLNAAEYYRAAGNSDGAAKCLYSAADSFVAAGLFGDATQTADLLIKLYPKTDYARVVKRLLE